MVLLIVRTDPNGDGDLEFVVTHPQTQTLRPSTVENRAVRLVSFFVHQATLKWPGERNVTDPPRSRGESEWTISAAEDAARSWSWLGCG